jgi:hypothetical protein
MHILHNHSPQSLDPHLAKAKVTPVENGWVSRTATSMPRAGIQLLIPAPEQYQPENEQIL